MRKIDIRDRVNELDYRLATRRDTSLQQIDERQRLVYACQCAGDHVFEFILLANDVQHVCMFCHVPAGISPEQLRRNLSRGH